MFRITILGINDCQKYFGYPHFEITHSLTHTHTDNKSLFNVSLNVLCFMIVDGYIPLKYPDYPSLALLLYILWGRKQYKQNYFEYNASHFSISGFVFILDAPIISLISLSSFSKPPLLSPFVCHFDFIFVTWFHSIYLFIYLSYSLETFFFYYSTADDFPNGYAAGTQIAISCFSTELHFSEITTKH